MVLLATQIFVSIVLRYVNVDLNRKKHRTLEEEKVRRRWTEEDDEQERQRHAFLDITDRQ